VDASCSSPQLRQRTGIYQRHQYAKEVREAFELWSQHIEALTNKKAAA